MKPQPVFSNQNDLAYRELMDDAARRIFDCVLVWKYDRFARSLSVLVVALQQFSTPGIDFISYTQNIDTTTAMGRLFYHVIDSFAEFEHEMIVERVRGVLQMPVRKEKPSAARRIVTPRCASSHYEGRASAFVRSSATVRKRRKTSFHVR